jgi:hypothetical protein
VLIIFTSILCRFLKVIILLVPANAIIASKARKYQIAQMKYKDQRVKLINEILSGVKVYI